MSYPTIRKSIAKYLKILKPDICKEYEKAENISESLMNCCKFLLSYPTQKEENFLEIAQYAEKSLASIVYHSSSSYIRGSIHLACQM